MNRIEILNSLIKKHNLEKYCEIGVEDGICFKAIDCGYKVGVDPDKNSAATVFETSDDFFKNLKESFDIYWIDGMHHDDFALRDINNALAYLNEGGFVCCHDMLPTNKAMQDIPRQQDVWTGNVWKAWVKLRSERPDLSMFVVDSDWGVGIIRKGIQEIITLNEDISYENFIRYRDNWMNVITTQEFKNKYTL